MSWTVKNLSGFRTQIKLNAGEAVIGLYQGIAPNAQFDDKWDVRMESLGGDPFSFRAGVTLLDYLQSQSGAFVGLVVCVKKCQKEGQAHTWKFSVWDGELTDLMQDQGAQAIIALTGRKLGK